MKHTTKKIIVYGLIILSLIALVFLARVKPAQARLNNNVFGIVVEADPAFVNWFTNPILTSLTTTNFFATSSVTISATTTNLYVSGSLNLPNNSITDAMVIDTITASNYLLLTGGTLTGGLIFTTASGTSITSTNLYVSSLANITQLGVNSSSPIAQLSVVGTGARNPVKVMSSTGAQLFAVNTNGQVVVGPNSLAQTGALTIESQPGNDITLSFTDGVNYTFQLGRVAGTSGQSFIGGPFGTALNLRSGGTDRVFIRNDTGYVGINTSSPVSQLSVVGTTTLNGLLNFTTALGTSLTSTNLEVTGSLTLPANSITDAIVVAGLTISGGTIDNTPIGNTTSSTGVFTNVTTTNLNVSTLGQITKLGINSSSPIAQFSVLGTSALNPVKVMSSTGVQLFAINTNGQVVVGANSLAQTGQLTIETPTTNDVALSFTNGTHYTFQLGRVAGSSGQAFIGGPGGTALNLRANGTDQVFIRTGGFVGIGSSTPSYNLTVTGTVGFANLTTNITGNGVCRTTNGEITDAGAAACIPSSLKYKTNVSLYNKSATNLFSRLFRIGAVDNYELKSNLGDPRKGLIADLVEKVDPDLIGYSKDGSVNTLHFEDITGLSVQAVAELDARVKKLEAQVRNLERLNK